MRADWSSFFEVDVPPFLPHDFCETLDGGQSFRWSKTDSFSESRPEYFGVFGKTAAILALDGRGRVLCSLPKNLRSASAKRVEEYLDCRRDYDAARKSLYGTKDPIMRKALKIHPTLRILRQDPEEALVCFICSSSKRIVQIKECVRLLSEKLGDEICDGVFSLPSFEKIDSADIETIRKCKLGFRSDYIKKTARKICADSFKAESLRSARYSEAKSYLTSLSGIGEKVADCILLFGAAKMEAFPVDTWIRKAMSELYGTPDNPSKIREFASEKFGKLAGFAQQLIFAAKRKNLL